MLLITPAVSEIWMLTPQTEQWLRVVLIGIGLLLIPVTVALMVVLFKLAFLLHSVYELVTIARYELFPILKDLRLTVDNVEEITHRTSAGLQEVSHQINQIRPNVHYGIRKVQTGVKALVSGLRRSFDEPS